MTERTPETPEASGIAVLADSDPDWDDGPFPVRGVALPEDITTTGNNEGESVYWPSDVVESAAAHFDGAKITDPSEHDPETAVERPQPSPDTIIGEVTAARYEPGVGVLYEGEVDDPEIAKRIERNRVEVSPTIFRTLGEAAEAQEARIPDSIVGVRDLSVVAEGQAEGNSIEPAAAAMSALSASALAAAFDAETTEAESSTDAAAATDEGQPGDDGADGSEPQSTGGPAETESMSDEDTLTDDQRELLAAAEAFDGDSDPIEVLDAAAGCEEPCVLDQSEVEAMQADLETLKQPFAEALEAQGSPLDAETLTTRLAVEELTEPFTDDESGAIDASTLVQTPETGQPEGSDFDDGAVAEVLEARGFEDRDEAVEVLQQKYDRFADAGWAANAEQVAEDLESLGVEV